MMERFCQDAVVVQDKRRAGGGKRNAGNSKKKQQQASKSKHSQPTEVSPNTKVPRRIEIFNADK